VRWRDLEARQPRLAQLGVERLLEPGVVLIATLRHDGSPRVSAVEPFLLDGELLLSMLWGSQKAHDLQRDQRVLVHSIVTSRSGSLGEYKVRGRAVPHDDASLQRRYSEAVSEKLGWRPVPGRFHLFSVDISDVTFIRYEDATGDQYVTQWPAGQEFVRRGTSPTSVGPPEPISDLLGSIPGPAPARNR
jgi:hypothetical protein